MLLDYIEVAEVIANYSAAGIPLETMWTDIGNVVATSSLVMTGLRLRDRLYVHAQSIHHGSCLFPDCSHARDHRLPT